MRKFLMLGLLWLTVANSFSYSDIFASEKEFHSKKLKSSTQTGLIAAVKAGKKNEVKKLLKLELSIDGKDKEGNTALHHAAQGGDVKILELLIKEGASRNAKNKKEQTPLHIAVVSGNFDVVQYLLGDSVIVVPTPRRGFKNQKKSPRKSRLKKIPKGRDRRAETSVDLTASDFYSQEKSGTYEGESKGSPKKSNKRGLLSSSLTSFDREEAFISEDAEEEDSFDSKKEWLESQSSDEDVSVKPRRRKKLFKGKSGQSSPRKKNAKKGTLRFKRKSKKANTEERSKGRRALTKSLPSSPRKKDQIKKGTRGRRRSSFSSSEDTLGKVRTSLRKERRDSKSAPTSPRKDQPILADPLSGISVDKLLHATKEKLEKDMSVEASSIESSDDGSEKQGTSLRKKAKSR